MSAPESAWPPFGLSKDWLLMYFDRLCSELFSVWPGDRAGGVIVSGIAVALGGVGGVGVGGFGSPTRLGSGGGLATVRSDVFPLLAGSGSTGCGGFMTVAARRSISEFTGLLIGGARCVGGVSMLTNRTT